MNSHSTVKSVSRWSLLVKTLAVAVIAVTLTENASTLESPSIAWARRGGSSGSDEVIRGVETDRLGNIYTAGNFKNTSTFSGTSTTLQSAGGSDVNVMKWNKNGSLLWARRFGSSGDDIAYDVATDDFYNTIVCGRFQQSVQFGSYTLTSVGSDSSSFVTKLNFAGRVLWAKAAPGVIPSECIADAAGHVLVVGSFRGTATWGTISKTSAGNLDAFVAKYDRNGNIQWVQTVAGSGTNLGRGVEVAEDGTNDILITGQFDGTQTMGTTQMTSNGSTDVWLGRLAPTGAWKWVKQIGGAGEDYGRGVSAKGSKIAIAGSFTGTINFLGQSLTSNGGTDVYVAKLNANGGLLWVNHTGSSDNDEGAEVNFDPRGNLLVVGTYWKSTTVSNVTNKSRDFLITLFDRNGNAQWLASPSGGSLSDVSYAAEADRFGNYLFAGFFRGTATFGTTTLTSAGSEDMVLGKIGRQ